VAVGKVARQIGGYVGLVPNNYRNRLTVATYQSA
jgi:hypothetical protein